VQAFIFHHRRCFTPYPSQALWRNHKGMMSFKENCPGTLFLMDGLSKARDWLISLISKPLHHLPLPGDQRILGKMEYKTIVKFWEVYFLKERISLNKNNWQETRRVKVELKVETLELKIKWHFPWLKLSVQSA
jgi:hypothetical protein